MGIMDWLRKLGILRYGSTKATYTKATERPAALQMDGVLDDRKDLSFSSPTEKKPDSSDRK